MNLTELASALAALSPYDRDTVLRMAYVEIKAPVEPINPAEPCAVRIAGRRELAEHGSDNVINVIKAVREATGVGLLDAKNAFERGVYREDGGGLSRDKAEKIADAATSAWRRMNRYEKSIWTPFAVVAAG